MPARSPRIAVYLPKHVAATIKRLAGLRGVSRSAVIRDFLEETQPVLERVANLLDLAARTDKSAVSEWVGTLEASQKEIEGDFLGAMKKFDDMEETLQQRLPLKKPGRPAAGERKRKRVAASHRRPRPRTPGQ